MISLEVVCPDFNRPDNSEIVSWFNMDYSTILGAMKRPLACDGAFRMASACGKEGVISSGRVTLTSGTAWAVGSIPLTSNSFSLVDVMQYLTQLRAKLFLLPGSEVKPSQMSHVLYVNFVQIAM